MSDEAILEALTGHWQYSGIDEDKAHEIYHEDAVLEFPQSGERFVGVVNFLAWRKKYPAHLDFRIRRITHEGGLWIAENLISYDGAPWMFTVSILEFRGEKVAHERIYIMEGWEPADSRADWAERFDPLDAITPADWRLAGPDGT
jgi:hypothetical protein